MIWLRSACRQAGGEAVAVDARRIWLRRLVVWYGRNVDRGNGVSSDVNFMQALIAPVLS
jgi:hypothetical protein